jgi:hypothetical protein
MAGFKTGIFVGAMIVGAPAAWLIWTLEHQPIMFPGKSISVLPSYVRLSGSIVGSEERLEDRPANNMIQMTCDKSAMSCSFLFADEIGHNFVGGIDEDILTVRKWDDRELIADSLNLASQFQGCNYYEVRVIFQSEDVTYNRLPNPQADKARCEELMGTSKPFRQWRIDDGPAWP